MESIKRKLTSNTFKEYIKLTDLKQNTKYSVDNFCINLSKYGDQLCVDVDKKFQLNLPNRFLKDFTEKDCKSINDQQEKITMIYKGTKTLNSGKTLHLIEFE